MATLTYVNRVRKSNINANESEARRRNHHGKTNREMGMQGIAMGGNNDQPEMGGIGETSVRFGVNLFKVVESKILP